MLEKVTNGKFSPYALFADRTWEEARLTVVGSRLVPANAYGLSIHIYCPEVSSVGSMDVAPKVNSGSDLIFETTTP